MFKRKFLSMVLLVGMLLGQSVPHAYAATFCDQAQFVSDITIPDGATFAPDTSFTKTWRFINNGTCTWTTSYTFVQISGDSMGAPSSTKVPVDVPPGQMVDISVNLTAPTTPGHYKSLWKFINTSGTQFGIGDSANDAFWVDINVIATDAVIYDFVANAPYAQWKSGAGPIPYPGTSGDRRGFSYQVDIPHLEDDSFDSLPGLLTVPQNKYNGYIQATYPEFQIQQGDKLQTLVNCEFGATGCYVTFRIDYLLPSGLQKTLWSWKEANDKRFYRANIDLSSLAGQKVRFVFMLLSSGYASGDRAIWGSPRIVRAGTTQPPAPPATLTLLPPLTPTQTPITPPPPTIASSGCDRATFITDVNIPDGTTFAPGAAFSKTWRLKNSGGCTWTKEYKLMYYSGEQMSAPTSINIPWNVYYGQTIDLTVNMVAPNSAGQYRGFWILANASGTMFGIGSNASNPFWVEINVTGDSLQGNSYNFWSNVCSAQWKSGAGPLPCPGTAGDSKGFVIADGFSHLEDGTMVPMPTLLMAPQNKYNGYIQGFYPAFTVQPGDHFVTSTGCEYGSSCYVTFRLDYMNPNGYIGNFWTWREQNDKMNHRADIDLTPLAGRSVRFILTILATGSANGDLVRWGGPMLVRTAESSPVTSIPPNNTPITNDWLTFTNSTYGYQFKYPPQAQIYNQYPESLLMNLPITPGTNLIEKYLDQRVFQNPGTCDHPTVGISPNRETVTISGITYFKDMGEEGGAGQVRKWTAYSTVRDDLCITSLFVLHSGNAYDPPKPAYDEAAESAVFLQMMSTFTWLITSPSLTPTPTFTPVPATSTPLPPPTLTLVPGTMISSPNIRQLYMIDSSNGWAIGDTYTLRTTNGGATWYNVLPDISPSEAFFASSVSGWVLSNSNVLYRTTNGGLNWTRYDVPFNGGYIQFLDNNNGFVLYGEASGMQKQAVSLYQTSDGGATWILRYNNTPTAPNPGTSLPFSGHKNGMAFRDTTTGWVGGDYPTNGYIYLFKTSDSGATWSQVSLPLPAGYESAFISTTAPKFFGTNDAILPVWMTLGTGMRDLFIYVTHNGGTTWTASPAFARNAEHTDVISMSNTISWDWANIFHTTNNSGNTWTTVTPNVNFGDDFRELDFVSATTGWVILRHPDNSTSLYRTTDGGSTWTMLYGHTPTPTPAPPTQTPVPPVSSLNAKVTADKLSCRYGPGAEYLYLYALNINANIKLIGRTDVNNWVWVDGTNKCWVNANYLTITGDRKALPIVYPGTAKLPVSPYYPAPAWASAYRNSDSVGVEWAAVPISAGDYEDAFMHQYILEVWRCEAGQIIFETLGSNSPSIVVAKDEPGCSVPSHGRVFVQEKHGYTGPVEPTWPQPVQPATGFITPISLTGPYAVVNIAVNDVLNIRSGAGVNQSIVGYYASDATDVMLTGESTSANGAMWVEARKNDGLTGWVNSYYLTEYVTHDAFCADSRILPLIEQAKQSMVQSNGNLLGPIVSPVHGVNMHLWAYGPGINFTQATSANIYTNTTVYNWGGGPSGIPDTGTFNDVVKPKYVDVFNTSNRETYCDDLTKVYPLSRPWPYPNIHFYNLYKPASGQLLDFRTLLIGIEYINGEPYIYSMVTIIWEP